MKYNNILETIGQTPHLKLNKTNPGGSIKDRIAHAMVRDAYRVDKQSIILTF